LFGRENPLLPSATELAYHTIRVSALNAEELRRENGLEVVSLSFNRCVDVIQPKSSSDEVSVQVATNVTRLFSVAAGFDKCREKLYAQPQVVSNVSRCIFFKGAPKLVSAAIESVTSFAIDKKLQDMVPEAHRLFCSLTLYPFF